MFAAGSVSDGDGVADVAGRGVVLDVFELEVAL